MGKPTDPPTTQPTLQDLIDEATEATGVLPPHSRCVELDRGLRAAIGALCLHAREEAKQHPEGSRDWYRLHNLVRDADEALKSSLGNGLLSAALCVGTLARQARALNNGVARR